MINDKDRCPVCKEGRLLFQSYKFKVCVNGKCSEYYIKHPWPLDAGQVSLIQHQR